MFKAVITFWKLRRAATPSRAFRVRLWQTLEAGLPPETKTMHRVALLRRATIGFAIILPVLLGGTSVYAYSSTSVTEGDALYPVKRGIEFVQLRLVRTPEGAAALHMQLYERRLDEAERLSGVRVNIIETLNAAAEENDYLESVTIMQELHEEMYTEMMHRLEESQERYEMVRGRVTVEEPNDEPSLRSPSFMMRRMKD